MKKMFQNPFRWHLLAAIFSFMAAICYKTAGHNDFAILWCIVTICNILLIWLTDNKE